MARVGTHFIDNLVPRTPNHSLLNSGIISTGGTTASASYPFGPWYTRKNNKSIVSNFSSSSVDTKSLKVIESRRPFFEDEYHWITNHYDQNYIVSGKYLGSGTIATDEYEVYGVTGQSENPLIKLSDGSYSGIIRNIPTVSTIDTFFTKKYGDLLVNYNTNKIALSKGVNGGVDWWHYKTDESDDDRDGVFIVCNGIGWGKQALQDPRYLEAFGLLSDSFPTTSAYDSTWNPPLPDSYFNPLNGDVEPVQIYTNYSGIPTADNIYPEFYWNQASQHAIPIYTKHYEENGKLVVLQSCWPIEYFSRLKGGDQLSSVYTSQWDPVSGFLQKPINNIERGYNEFNQPMSVDTMVVQKLTLDYFEKNIHRVENAHYQNFRWWVDQYYNYESGASAIFGSVSALLNAIPAMNTSNGIGCFGESRYDRVYLYSPENKKLIDPLQLSSTSANIYVAADPMSQNLPVATTVQIQVPFQLTGRNLGMRYILYENGINSQGNFLEIDNYHFSGTYPNVRQVRYFNVIEPGSEYYPSSQYVSYILERSANNPAGLKPICVAFFTVLNPENKDTYTSYRAVRRFDLNSEQRVYSGTWDQPGYGDANFLWTSSNWGVSGEVVRGGFSNNTLISGYIYSIFAGKGWAAYEHFLIVGETKDEVIEKLNRFYETNKQNFVVFKDAKSFVPDILYNYNSPFKAGRIF